MLFGKQANGFGMRVKSGKPNYADVGAYRPITISSYIGKLLERVLKAGIVKFLEEKAVLKDSMDLNPVSVQPPT